MEVRHTVRLLVLALTLLQVGSASIGQASDHADQAESQAAALKDAPLQDKRGWADFNTWENRWADLPSWDKRWSNFPSWGKRWSNFPSWGKKWSNFPSWGKKWSDDPSSGKRWSNFPTWGKRWSNFPSWGKKWSNFPSWGKKWSNFPSWGKKWSNFASWGKKWSLQNLPKNPARSKNTSWEFGSWGKRSDQDKNSQGRVRQTRWDALNTWGKRSSQEQDRPSQAPGKRGGLDRGVRQTRWDALQTWGKRSSPDQDRPLETQKILDAFDVNGDGELQPIEAVELLTWMAQMHEQASQ